jgi:hypothetical protein
MSAVRSLPGLNRTFQRISYGFHVCDVDVLARAFDVNHGAAEASGLAACELGRQLASRIPHRVFPRCPGAVLPIFVEVGLGAVRQEQAPGRLEIGARMVKRRLGAALVLSGMRAGIKPAAPAPRVGVSRIARAERDRADTDVAVVDQPGRLWGVRVAAACQDWHAP